MAGRGWASGHGCRQLGVGRKRGDKWQERQVAGRQEQILGAWCGCLAAFSSTTFPVVVVGTNLRGPPNNSFIYTWKTINFL